MISSVAKAPRFGSGRAGGKLVVDGRDETVFRKAQIAFKPAGARQKRSLLALLDATRDVYNAGLQERRDAYRHSSQTRIALFDQFNQIKDLRGARDDVLVWGISPLRWALRRLDEAFGGFFRRVVAGETPGYPRFKSFTRWDTIGYDETTGWRLHLDAPTRPGNKAAARTFRPHLYVQGIGSIPLSKSAIRQLKRYATRGGVPTTLTLTRINREGTAWRASIGFKNLAVETPRMAPTAGSVVGIDRGVAVLLATAAADSYTDDQGQLLHHTDDLMTNLAALGSQIEELQRQRSSRKKYGRAWRQLSRRIRRLHRRQSNIEENWARHTAKALVAQHEVLVLEDLNLQGMTRSVKGTIQEPGKNVAAKTGLNRALAEAAPGRLARWITVKAESAGLGHRVWLVNPAHTSQQCSACGVIDAASRVNRQTYYCGACGWYEHADTNAARNIRARGMAAEKAWAAAGSPPLTRPKPRLRRRNPLQTAEPAAA